MELSAKVDELRHQITKLAKTVETAAEEIDKVELNLKIRKLQKFETNSELNNSLS